MNHYFISNDQLKAQMLVDGMALYQQKMAFEGALDLSRRRFSVETPCKTPSPYTGSSFGDEGSPSTSHDSPSTTSVSTSNIQRNALSRSDTPLRHYPSPTASLNNFGAVSPNDIHQSYHHREHQLHSDYIRKSPEFEMQREVKREVVSPVPDHHHHEETDSAAIAKTNELNAYMMKAVAFQKQMAQIKLVSDEQPDIPNSPPSLPLSPPSLYPMMMGRDGKPARPFKAYPRDPLSISANFTATDSMIGSDSAEKYQSFRKRMLDQIHAANGGQPTISNPKMRRTTKSTPSTSTNNPVSSSSAVSAASLMQAAAAASAAAAEQMKHEQKLSDEAREAQEANDSNNNNSDSGSVKDSAYFERRKKNNAAAKKSRDRRRIKEDEIAIRAAYLERENLDLKYQLNAAHKQLALYGISTST